MVGLPMAVYLPAVYADNEGFGLGLAFVGAVLVIARLFDGVTDPIVGFISDRWRTRWGRRKPFVLLGTPIYIFGICMLFIPPVAFTELTFLGFTFNSGYPWMLAMLVITTLALPSRMFPIVHGEQSFQLTITREHWLPAGEKASALLDH